MTAYAGSVPDTLTRPTDWLAVAPCKADPEAMFATNPIGIEYAKTICQTCSVTASCLEWALDTGEEYGVWGGLSEAERRDILRQTLRRKPAVVPGEDPLRKAWEKHTEPGGEHLLWTGPKIVRRRLGKDITPGRLSFFLDRGRWPVGDTLRSCGVAKCVLPAHLSDHRERREAAG